MHQPIRTRSPGCTEECSSSAAGLFCRRLLNMCFFRILSSSVCLWSLSHMKTHKPGFPCKSLRITLEVTQRDDQYARVFLLPTNSQHGCCKFITSYSLGKKLTYLKLTVFSRSLCEEEGESGCGQVQSISHAFVFHMQSQTCNWHKYLMCTLCDEHRCLQMKRITVKPAGSFCLHASSRF